MKQTIKQSLQDLFSKEVILFVIKIGMLSIAISITTVWLFWDNLTALVESFLSWIPWEWLQGAGAGIINLLLVYILFTIVVSILTSLMSENLLRKLIKRHYPSISASGTATIKRSIWLTLKATVIFLLLFLIAIPLIFIPVIGQAVMLYLWSVLIKEPTIYDVTALFDHAEEIKSSKSKGYSILAMIASMFNYIPILNLFTPIFAQILFLHYVLSYSKQKIAADHL
ncbi:MAG: hypothetical protein HF962_04790 [Sulfurovum sp.]|nr:hypothetical protein [Sulfurovum sp.]